MEISKHEWKADRFHLAKHYGLRFSCIAWISCLAFFYAGAARGAETDSALVGEISQCIERISRTTPKARENNPIDLDRFCARIRDKMGSPHIQSSSPDPKSNTSLAELRDLRLLLSDSARTASRQNVADLDHRQLGKILSETLVEQNTRKTSWWDSFVNWLSEKLGGSDSKAPQWLVDFLKSISPPEWLGKVLFQLTMVVLVLSAILIIGNEWRQSGYPFFSIRKRSRKDTALSPADYKKPVSLSLNQIREMPTNLGVHALLKFCVAVLTKHGFLPDKPSQTGSEMLASLTRKEKVLATHFLPIVHLSDSHLYGEVPVDKNDFSSVCHEAESIADLEHKP